LLLLLALFFILSRGRKKTVAEAAALAAEAIAEAAAAAPVIAEPTAPGTATAVGPAGKAINTVPIAEDPQKAYYREQIQQLGKSNPGTVAQLIQTWMDEDRRN
jgi:flagellar biosynthesis/type III secretory pathway M-ring protein FliF/YscJ